MKQTKLAQQSVITRETLGRNIYISFSIVMFTTLKSIVVIVNCGSPYAAAINLVFVIAAAAAAAVIDC